MHGTMNIKFTLDIVIKIIFGVALMCYNRNHDKDTQLRNHHLKKCLNYLHMIHWQWEH